MVLSEKDIFKKISVIEKACHEALSGHGESVPVVPARDISFVRDSSPPKVGLSYKEGQARLLHDLANIELQAMELGLRTLLEFQDAPKEFREQLAALTISESTHLKLCLDGVHELGFAWGHWPIHLGLWQATSVEDSLLDRILIVHRYLEGSGLDAGETFIRKLNGVEESCTHKIVRTILTEELDHVAFGSRWYHQICLNEKINSQNDFDSRMNKLRYKLPRRIERLSLDLRRKAGFTNEELLVLAELRKDSEQIKSLHLALKSATDLQAACQA